jgi:hypothetical protein
VRASALLRLLLFSAILLACGWARAQGSPYASAVYKEGPGFRLGSSPLVIHPGLSVELGYDSNVFYQPSNEVGSGILRLRGHLDLATLPPQNFAEDTSTADPKVEFRFSTILDYREFLSGDAAVRAQRSLNLTLGAQLVILPKSLFSLTISDAFVRSVDPRNEECPVTPTAGSLCGTQFTRDHNHLALLGTFHRGGMEVGIGDAFDVDFWENSDLSFGNTYTDEAQAFAKLHILPQTTGQITVRAGYVYYPDRGPNFSNSMIPVRVMVGASSLFASWFGASANIGYGNSINNSGPSFNSAIANLEVRFLLPKQMGLTIMYDRDFRPSLFANFFGDDKISIAYELPFLNGVTIHLDGGMIFRHYEGLAPPTKVNAVAYTRKDRDDVLYDAHAELRYKATSWLQVAAVYNLLVDSTRFGFISEGRPLGAPLNSSFGRYEIPIGYIKHTVLAQADFAY